MRAQEVARRLIVRLDPLDERAVDPPHARGDGLGGRRPRGRVLRDHHHEDRVLAGQPLLEAAQVAHRGRVLRQQVREVSEQPQPRGDEEERRRQDHEPAERDPHLAALEPARVAARKRARLRISISQGA